MVDKAKRAQLSALWIKIADGARRFDNVKDPTATALEALIGACRLSNIEVWGWQVPHAATIAAADAEADNVHALAVRFGFDGLILDAEGGGKYFHGGVNEASHYARKMRDVANAIERPLAISSNDIPNNIAGWPPRFDRIARVCDFNAPQVYYGSSPSVLNRLTRAEDANSHLPIPFVPVGAAWVGDEGGCESASACAERAREFIRLVHERGYRGYSFWHWAGAPMPFWEVLNTVAA